jgi:hypothetical protein
MGRSRVDLDLEGLQLLRQNRAEFEPLGYLQPVVLGGDL